MKKVLFIAYLYPPIANSGTRRSLEFVNYLPDYDWSPIVLTVANPSPKSCDPSLLHEVRPNTHIERTPLWSDLVAVKISKIFSVLFDRNWIMEGLKYRIQRLISVPDECATWGVTAIRRAEEIYKSEGFDMIYASGWPWTSFLIAAEVSRRTGRPYVLDYRDLWKSYGDVEWDKRTFLQNWFATHLEKIVISRAAAVVSTTPSFIKELNKNAIEGKTICITNGFDPDDFNYNTSTVENSNQDHFVRVVYTGVWRPGYGPEDLYLAVRQLKDINADCLRRLKVIVAGFPSGRAREYGVEDIIEELGSVPHEYAVDLMMHSSVLYLPVSKGIYEKASIPGKLFEYVGSGRPILASALPESEVAKILASVGGAYIVSPREVQHIAAFLERLCSPNNLQLFSERHTDMVNQYTRYSLTEKLAALFDSVLLDRDLTIIK
jgi:glycosyltransferase involved in cell wall biosynthesis